MPNFYYEAIEKNGTMVKGTIKADSANMAKEHLRAQGHIPTLLKEQRPRTMFSISLERFTQQDLALATRQLATLLSAGIPIEEALQGVSEQTDKAKVRSVLSGVRNKIIEGYSLLQALNEYAQYFPDLYRTTVGAGEQTGRLDQILENLADYIEKQHAIRQKVQHALIYPIVMMVVSASIITFLLTYIVPSMVQVFTDSGQTLPFSTIALIAISNFLKFYGIYLVIFIVALIIIFKFMLKNPQNKFAFHLFLLKVPIIAYLIRSINVARYINTFSILFSCGVNVLETMRIASQVVQSLPMRKAFEEATIEVREGRDISSSLKTTAYISPMALHLIASGEKSGELASMMQRAGWHIDKEISQLIDTALTLLEPFMIIIMGGVVMFIVLATLLPIFSMEQLVS
ncbi:MAG: type II secretion system protein GspF [Legionellales bacterium RIFCSPHIGHO2_12_FULL_37_14]|nr:MAG: type II secretion system protein GspF [Legionellales bacterium RIFCSPHIGHO2_12_FULL_37_14]